MVDKTHDFIWGTFLEFMDKDMLLYTEMIALPKQTIYDDLEKFSFQEEENKVALQIASNAEVLIRQLN